MSRFQREHVYQPLRLDIHKHGRKSIEKSKSPELAVKLASSSSMATVACTLCWGRWLLGLKRGNARWERLRSLPNNGVPIEIQKKKHGLPSFAHLLPILCPFKLHFLGRPRNWSHGERRVHCQRLRYPSSPWKRWLSPNGGPESWGYPKSSKSWDHFSTETYGDLGISHFRNLQ